MSCQLGSSDPKRSNIQRHLAEAGSGGNRDFIIGGDIVQERAQRLGAFAAQCRLELRLRLPPAFERAATAFGARFGQSQFLAAAI